MDLSRYNHWWIRKKVDPALAGRERDAFEDILKYIDKRQAVLLKGLRRVGKTTLFYQLINYLITERKINPYNIIYFTFDEDIQSIEAILKEYQRLVLKREFGTLKNEVIYIFLDEIQKLKGWTNQIKIYYDLYPNFKFFLSGSESIGLARDVKENLGGRVYDFIIKPLGFREYLKFKNVDIDYQRMDIYKDTLQFEVSNYLKNSGFIEMIWELDDEILRKYFRESLLEKVLYKDIPEVFSVNEPAALFKILRILAKSPGMLVKYNELGSDLKIDQRTVRNYFSFLKASFLVHCQYQFSKNLLTSEKKLKRYYLSHSCFSNFFSEEPYKEGYMDNLIENLFVTIRDSQFFYRSPTMQEVDIVEVKDGETVPIEIKYKNNIMKKDIRGMLSFIKKYSPKEAIIISKDQWERLQILETTVEIVPHWKFLCLC